jgi:hypothetical protein
MVFNMTTVSIIPEKAWLFQKKPGHEQMYTPSVHKLTVCQVFFLDLDLYFLTKVVPMVCTFGFQVRIPLEAKAFSIASMFGLGLFTVIVYSIRGLAPISGG